MNLNETAHLLAVVQVGDNRRVDELTVQEWHHAVGDLGIDDAVAAVREHRRTSSEYLGAHHVRAGVKRLRAARLDHAALPEPPVAVADSPARYLEWLRDTRRAIADGRPPTPDQAALVHRGDVMAALPATFKALRKDDQ